MNRTVLVTVCLLASVGACGNDPPASPATPADVAACKAAMQRDFDRSTTSPDAPAASVPPECNGVDDATLQRLVGEIIDEATGG